MAIGSLVAVPDLLSEGPARLEAQKRGWLQIRFLRSGAVKNEEARLVARYCLLPGTRVRIACDEDEREAVIAAVPPSTDKGTGLVVYPVETDDGVVAVDERAVVAVHDEDDPLCRLHSVAFHDLRPRLAKAGTPRPPEAWGPQTFSAREELLAWRDGAWRRTGGVIALAGSRVRALPHQLLAARRILADRQVRFLLADEVGLGKTIEAGLVMQSLLAMRPSMRVLVVVPGALVSQWFVELFVKFGGRRFLMLDAERLADYRGNPWQEQFVIASSRSIESLGGKAALRFATTSWDMVVVDECHRMQPGGPLYKRLAMLSKRAPHLLLLSATPGRQHPDAYLALLHLLQPDAYDLDDLAAFRTTQEAQGAITELVRRTRAVSEAERPALADAWRQRLGTDRELVALLERWTAGAANAEDDLIGHVREHHRLDYRVIRNRRHVLARLSQATGIAGMGLAERTREWIEYALEPVEHIMRDALDAYRAGLVRLHAVRGALPPRLAHWLLQVHLAAAAHPRVLERLLAMRAAVLAEPEEYEEYRLRALPDETLAQVLRPDLSEAETLAHVAVSAACHLDEEEMPLLTELRGQVDRACTRIPGRTRALAEAIVAFWREHPREKILVFTSHALAVTAIAEILRRRLSGTEVVTFGAHQDAMEREEAVRRFREGDECAVMVSDPLGGEGRNFQFVSVVAHHDLPWSVAAVEQRIGRVDRLGRDGLVPSWVMVPEDSTIVDGAWARLLDEAVGVFTESSSGLEFICDRFEARALQAALTGGGEALQACTEELSAMVVAERTALDREEDDLSAAGARAYAEAADLARAIEDERAPIGALCRWLRGMGGGVRRDDDPPRSWHLRPRAATEAVDGVFDRAAALRHERLAFFALGHQLVDHLLDDAQAAIWCAANAWRRPAAPGCAQWEGVRVTFELVLDLVPVITAGIPLEALRRIFLVAPDPRLVRFLRVADGAVEDNAAVCAHLEPLFGTERGDRPLSVKTSRDLWMRPLLSQRFAQVTAWQDRVANAAAAVPGLAEELGAELRQAVAEPLEHALHRAVTVAESRARHALDRLGRGHPDEERLRAEAAQERDQAAALRAAVAGAVLRPAAAAYIVVQ